ncbi:MAG: FixH family protein [Pseudomonadota bacterium]
MKRRNEIRTLDGARPLTGRVVAIVAVSAFGVILAVNLTMAWFATSGFPGLVVKNAYIASQGWDRNRAAQNALGWQVTAALANTALSVEILTRTGSPLGGLVVEAEIARPTALEGAQTVLLRFDGARYRSEVDLASGRWAAALTVTAPDGAVWTGQAALWRD